VILFVLPVEVSVVKKPVFAVHALDREHSRRARTGRIAGVSKGDVRASTAKTV